MVKRNEKKYNTDTYASSYHSNIRFKSALGRIRIEASTSIYPDVFLSFMIPFHIVCGAVGAFVLCPIAVFSHKGGITHRRVGRLFLIDVIFVAVSGAILLIDPLFLLVFWPMESAISEFGQYFQSAHYPELFFLYLNSTLIYFSFSGVRVWQLVGYGHAKVVSSNWIDWCLALGMGIFAIGFLMIGILDLIHAERMALEFIIAGCIVLSFGGCTS